jgi:hypothetical protein
MKWDDVADYPNISREMYDTPHFLMVEHMDMLEEPVKGVNGQSFIVFVSNLLQHSTVFAPFLPPSTRPTRK